MHVKKDWMLFLLIHLVQVGFGSVLIFLQIRDPDPEMDCYPSSEKTSPLIWG